MRLRRYYLERRKSDGRWQRDWRLGPFVHYATAVRHATNAEGHIGIRILDLATGRICAVESRWLDDAEYHRARKGLDRFLRRMRARMSEG
jgi:hypothetical protein